MSNDSVPTPNTSSDEKAIPAPAEQTAAQPSANAAAASELNVPTGEAKKNATSPSMQQSVTAEPSSQTTGEDQLVAEETGKNELHEKEDEAEPVDSADSALHEEAEAEDVEYHEKLAVEEEAEEVPEPVTRRDTEARRKSAKMANIIGFSINAVLLLIIIWLVKVKFSPPEENTAEPVTEVIQMPVKQSSTAVVDSPNATPLPAVAVQGEPKNPEGTPARAIEDVVRTQNLRCRIERFTFAPNFGVLNISLRKDAFWDMQDLKRSAEHDAVLIMRSVFGKPEVKALALTVEARLDNKMGETPYEKILGLRVSREDFESSGLADSADLTIPPALHPQYHEKLANLQ